MTKKSLIQQAEEKMEKTRVTMELEDLKFTGRWNINGRVFYCEMDGIDAECDDCGKSINRCELNLTLKELKEIIIFLEAALESRKELEDA